MIDSLTYAYRSAAAISLRNRKPPLASIEVGGTRNSCHRTLGGGRTSYVGGVDGVPDIREDDGNAGRGCSSRARG